MADNLKTAPSANNKKVENKNLLKKRQGNLFSNPLVRNLAVAASVLVIGVGAIAYSFIAKQSEDAKASSLPVQVLKLDDLSNPVCVNTPVALLTPDGSSRSSDSSISQINKIQLGSNFQCTYSINKSSLSPAFILPDGGFKVGLSQPYGSSNSTDPLGSGDCTVAPIANGANGDLKALGIKYQVVCKNISSTTGQGRGTLNPGEADNWIVNKGQYKNMGKVTLVSDYLTTTKTLSLDDIGKSTDCNGIKTVPLGSIYSCTYPIINGIPGYTYKVDGLKAGTSQPYGSINSTEPAGTGDCKTGFAPQAPLSNTDTNIAIEPSPVVICNNISTTPGKGRSDLKVGQADTWLTLYGAYKNIGSIKLTLPGDPTNCNNGAVNPPACNVCPVNQVFSGNICVSPIDKCKNGAVNPPACNQCPAQQTLKNGICIPSASLLSNVNNSTDCTDTTEVVYLGYRKVSCSFIVPFGNLSDYQNADIVATIAGSLVSSKKCVVSSLERPNQTGDAILPNQIKISCAELRTDGIEKTGITKVYLSIGAPNYEFATKGTVNVISAPVYAI